MIHYYLSKNLDRWFSPGSPVSSTNKTDRHDTGIAEILLKEPLSTHNPNPIVNGTQSQDGNILLRLFVLLIASHCSYSTYILCLNFISFICSFLVRAETESKNI